ncbi:YkvA family protein [Pseudomonas typographi]|uniref:DUF1232 domain-containing protein n=1 Tax=Pseudomonas typographi TaxID=2715964 RepID=A0ABR7YY00_9PSED|nr:DUF1232 domain-containing protein [Pseudomonas typographi]MBD1550448.1 DUF1232 domain-containing protein [Pseudomonas typographi]MBD1587875.1 DUF1232 domain-containing protein [Pseudomonas typographi]MBD1598083.1 DUF1232 domain-containing protein [Pseudomonas typographi]
MKTPLGFTRFLPLAARLLKRGRLPALVLAASHKLKGRGPAKLREDAGLLVALCSAYWKGEYRAISGKAMLSVVAGLLYFVSPIDVIPDWLLGVGMLDDLAVLGWVTKVLAGELDAFRAWRQAQDPAALQVVERVPEGASALEGEYLGR